MSEMLFCMAELQIVSKFLTLYDSARTSAVAPAASRGYAATSSWSTAALWPFPHASAVAVASASSSDAELDAATEEMINICVTFDNDLRKCKEHITARWSSWSSKRKAAKLHYWKKLTGEEERRKGQHYSEDTCDLPWTDLNEGERILNPMSCPGCSRLSIIKHLLQMIETSGVIKGTYTNDYSRSQMITMFLTHSVDLLDELGYKPWRLHARTYYGYLEMIGINTYRDRERTHSVGGSGSADAMATLSLTGGVGQRRVRPPHRSPPLSRRKTRRRKTNRTRKTRRKTKRRKQGSKKKKQRKKTRTKRRR